VRWGEEYKALAGTGATQQVKETNRAVAEKAVDIEPEEPSPETSKIHAGTKYDFAGRNLTAYGGLLPVAAMLEKLHFSNLVCPTGHIGNASIRSHG
jgi:hypothetical protein